jgi:hypothetical protein
MKTIAWVLTPAFLIGVLTCAASADYVNFAVTPTAYASLGVTGEYSTETKTGNWNSSGWTGSVVSHVYTLSSSNYLYVYQVFNNGPTSPLEVLTFSQFHDPQTSSAGYLTSVPVGGPFVADGQATFSQAFDAPNNTLSYRWLVPAIPAGAHSFAFYLISPDAPTAGTGFVIDSGAPTGPIWVAAPEPASMSLLMIGAVALLRRKTGNRA